MDAKQINQILGIKDSYQAPEVLMNMMLDDTKRKKVFEDFRKLENNLDYEWFQKYFEDEHSDRKNKKQDFTPVSISSLLEKIAGQSKSYFEAAAGIGGIMIQSWKENKENLNRRYYLEELSSRSIPFLLFNMAIRKINGIVYHGDSLENKAEAIYKVENGKVIPVDQLDILNETEHHTDTVLMNPPFSASWSANRELINDDRFKDYKKLAPKSKADYAFLLHGYDRLDAEGTMAIVLPHGVLFRGASEGAIRTALLEKGAIYAVIGLPGKLFLNTDIPTTILVLKKNRESKDVLFIDTSKEFEKIKDGRNHLTNEHLNKITETYIARKDIEKYAHLASFEEIKDNDFNLNIPRYVDTFEEEEPIDMGALALEIMQLDVEIAKSEKELGSMLEELTVPNGDPELIQYLELSKKMFGVKAPKKDKQDENQITLELLEEDEYA